MKDTIKVALNVPVLYVLSLLGMLAFFVIKINVLPPQVPLYYSLPGSDQQVVQVYYIFLLPIFSLLFISINSLLSSKFLTDEFPRKITRYMNYFVIGIMFYIFIRIIALVS